MDRRPRHHSPQSPMLHRVPSRWNSCGGTSARVAAPTLPYRVRLSVPFPCRGLPAGRGTSGAHPWHHRASRLALPRWGPDAHARPSRCWWRKTRPCPGTRRGSMTHAPPTACCALYHACPWPSLRCDTAQARRIAGGACSSHPRPETSSRDADDLFRTVESLSGRHVCPRRQPGHRLAGSARLTVRRSRARNHGAQWVAQLVEVTRWSRRTSDTVCTCRVRLVVWGTVAASRLLAGTLPGRGERHRPRKSLYNYRVYGSTAVVFKVSGRVHECFHRRDPTTASHRCGLASRRSRRCFWPSGSRWPSQ